MRFFAAISKLDRHGLIAVFKAAFTRRALLSLRSAPTTALVRAQRELERRSSLPLALPFSSTLSFRP